VEPDGVHRFKACQGGCDDAPWSYVRRGYSLLLLYPYPSFEAWQSKFSLYGEFFDWWFDDERYPNKLDFML
jgi:hypothetical protein